MKRKPKRAVSRPADRGGAPPPEKSLANVTKLFRAIHHPEFMRHGRPDDRGGLRKYMLDTDTCLLMAEGHPTVAGRIVKMEEGAVVVSAITLAELRYGAGTIHEAERKKFGLRVLEEILELVPVVPFDEGAALAYAAVRMSDPKRNIRAMDKLIAAHAIALNLTLVTNNLKDFRKFRPPLRMENWAAKGR